MTADDVVVLVMAAGRSRRFGRDKRTARLADGRPLLAATRESVSRTYPLQRLILREGEGPASLGLSPSVPHWRVPSSILEGLGTSLGHAVRTACLDPELAHCRTLAIWLGDMPWIAPATSEALLTQARDDTILRPTHDGQPGHPVLFGRTFWPELSNLTGDQGAHELLVRHRERCHHLPVDDPGVLRDVDRPQDLDRSSLRP
ncbi:nucleotidyltransferase family protein [Halomonas elongata]|uniref:nucleotidyltransferase family protein n=1 Tax=Halomonas elongata TaxID=2746 RepID=UPI00186BA57F|nr:nucleotidyltransferase family protein [Halomonas elongata]MBW5801246.1 nucleotidyltransferase family protein [Halomonas elongata]